MNLLQSLLLGLLQGVTEFLPVSSSGHLVMARLLLGIDDVPILFDILLHLSTLVAVALVFRQRILSIVVALVDFVRRRTTAEDRINLKLLRLVILATVLTAIVGVGLSYLDAELHPKLVSSLFIVTGLILIGTKFLHGSKQYDSIGAREALITGVAQGIGVLPGISRSGITISAALLAGIDREKAGELSFLIAIPAILGAALLDFKQAGDLMNVVTPMSLAVGICAAFSAGLVSLLLLIRLIRGGKLYLFSVYLVPLGIVGLIVA